MKNPFVKFMSIGIICSSLIYSCKKTEDVSANVSDDEMSIGTTQAADVDNSTSSTDDAINTINDNLASYGTSGARIATETDCSLTVDYSGYSTVSGSNQKTIVYSFNSNNTCNGRTKTGTITVTLVQGDHFKDAGAVYTVSFDGYGVSSSQGKTVTISGIQTITNVSGGLPKQVLSQSSLTVNHTIEGTMVLTFDNGTTRSWQLSRDITWANANGVISSTVKGNASEDGYDNLSVWGTNRLNGKFYTQIVTPITFNSSCGWFLPTGGERKHTVITATGGVYTITSTITTGTDGCGSGYTVTITTPRGKSKTVTVTY